MERPSRLLLLLLTLKVVSMSLLLLLLLLLLSFLLFLLPLLLVGHARDVLPTSSPSSLLLPGHFFSGFVYSPGQKKMTDF